MHILFLSPELLSSGGIQRQNRLVIAALDELLCDNNGLLDVLVLNDCRPKSPHPELENLRATGMAFFAGNRPAYFRAFVQKSQRVDVIIYGLLGFAPMCLARVVSVHSCQQLLMIYGIEAWSRRSFLHSIAVRALHGYVSISRYTLDRFRHAYRIDPTKFSFILPNAVSPELLGSIHPVTPETVAARAKLLTVSAMRSHDQQKGIDTIIRALPSVIQQFPSLEYTIIGDGSDRARLEELAVNLGVKAHVTFRGTVTDAELREAYTGCDVFALPSAKEGFGFVFIEAMAYNKPVVAARAGAAPEVVLENETGILVDYGDDRQLAEALIRLFSHPELCCTLGEAGKRRVEALYSFEALKVNLAQVLLK